MLEREIAGFGASGRNGGWCSALFPASRERSRSRRHGRRRGARHAAGDGRHGRRGRPGRRGRGHRLRLRQGRHADARPHRAAARAGPRGARRRPRLRVRPTTPLAARRPRPGAVGAPACSARRTPRTARAIHPAQLVRGLARAVERRGVAIHERTAGHRDRGPGRGRDATAATVRAPVVVRATEGYTPRLPGLRRGVAPVYSLMIATEPLPADSLGRDRAAPARDVHRRPAPDHLRPAHRRRPVRVRRPRRAVPLRLAHPARRSTATSGCSTRCSARCASCSRRSATRRITHRWGGPLGVAARLVRRRVGFDRATGLAWAGGYVGDGVATTNLAGRTLADLILGRDTDADRLPWVGHRSRALGAGAAALGRRAAVRRLANGGGRGRGPHRHAARRAALISRLTGG